LALVHHLGFGIILEAEEKGVLLGMFSSWFLVISGVPQGRFLGHIFFLHVSDTITCKMVEYCVLFTEPKHKEGYSQDYKSNPY